MTVICFARSRAAFHKVSTGTYVGNLLRRWARHLASKRPKISHQVSPSSNVSNFLSFLCASRLTLVWLHQTANQVKTPIVRQNSPTRRLGTRQIRPQGMPAAFHAWHRAQQRLPCVSMRSVNPMEQVPYRLNGGQNARLWKAG